jgi:prevent-host-death family protein
MDVSVRELRNHTAKVVAAIESGESVVLTVHGRPVADIVPRQQRSERRSSEALLADLAEISAIAKQLEAGPVPDVSDVFGTTDDFFERLSD